MIYRKTPHNSADAREDMYSWIKSIDKFLLEVENFADPNFNTYDINLKKL